MIQNLLVFSGKNLKGRGIKAPRPFNKHQIKSRGSLGRGPRLLATTFCQSALDGHNSLLEVRHHQLPHAISIYVFCFEFILPFLKGGRENVKQNLKSA